MTLSHKVSVFGLLVGAFVVSAGMAASNWYVAPNGTPYGTGSLERPYDLPTALSGTVGNPGDVFWLRGGTYVIGHIDTRIQGAPGQPITFRPMVGESPRVDGSLSFFDSAGYVVLQDFEVYSSDANRVSAERNAGFKPTDIHPVNGIASYSPNMSFINLIVHDETGEGIYISHEGTNNLIYGCVIYNNGWRSPDNAEGHGIYVQGYLGTREISDNIVFNNSGACLHVYDNATNAYLAGITMDGNAAFNAGAIQNIRFYRDWIVGVDEPAIGTDGIIFENNMGYPPRTIGEDDATQIGRQGINGSVTILNNYLPQGLELNNWTSATVTGNVVAATSGGQTIDLNQALTPLAATWNNNTYLIRMGGGGFQNNSAKLSFPMWQKATGFDLKSTCRVGTLAGTQLFVRPNRFVPSRANIIVYNWGRQSTVSVDVSKVLPLNTSYEVRNAENILTKPVASGIYLGKPLVLPMYGLKVSVPNGRMLTPPPTGPLLNVFVLLPRPVSLQIKATTDQVHLSWPTNSGKWILQTASSLNAGAWRDVAKAPSIDGADYVLTEAFSPQTQYYRLRPSL
jgi:hypothetical protein